MVTATSIILPDNAGRLSSHKPKRIAFINLLRGLAAVVMIETRMMNATVPNELGAFSSYVKKIVWAAIVLLLISLFIEPTASRAYPVYDYAEIQPESLFPPSWGRTSAVCVTVFL